MKLKTLNSRSRRAGPKPPPEPLKLDFGCGPNKKAGFTGVDSIAFPGVDVVVNLVEENHEELINGGTCVRRSEKSLGFKPWPWKNDSVEEAHASHFIEHLDQMQRVHFWNELYRVLKVGAKLTLICPDWSSSRAYGDPTHKWPPMCDFALFYISREWREGNAPHTKSDHLAWGFKCNFQATWGYALHQEVSCRNQEYQQHAMTWFKNACQDIVVTATKLA